MHCETMKVIGSVGTITSANMPNFYPVTELHLQQAADNLSIDNVMPIPIPPNIPIPMTPAPPNTENPEKMQILSRLITDTLPYKIHKPTQYEISKYKIIKSVSPTNNSKTKPILTKVNEQDSDSDDDDDDEKMAIKDTWCNNNQTEYTTFSRMNNWMDYHLNKYKETKHLNVEWKSKKDTILRQWNEKAPTTARRSRTAKYVDGFKVNYLQYMYIYNI